MSQATPELGGSVPEKETMTLAEFRAKIRDSQVTCIMCTFKSHSLVDHLREKHGLSPGQYKNKFGEDLMLASPLTLEILRKIPKNPILFQLDYTKILLPGMFSQLPAEMMKWKELVNKLGPWIPEVLELVPEVNKNFIFTDNAPLIALSLVQGRNCYTAGPTGAGKTEEVMQVMARLGVPLQRANMHGEVTYGTFVGHMKANTNGTYFQEGMLPRAMVGGYPILVDEMDFMPPSISSVLYPVLEGSRTLYIPETGVTVKAKKGFTVFGTGNTGGKGDLDGTYTGTEVLNSAYLDRFSMRLQASYLSKDKEGGLMKIVYPKVGENFLKATLQLAEDVREAFLQGEITVTWSTRKMLEFMDLAQMLGVKKALEVTLLNWLDKNDMNLIMPIVNKTGLLTVAFEV